MFTNLYDKVIVLTGATGGIGKEISKTLLYNGAKMVLQYHLILPDTKKYETENTLYIKADITNYQDVMNLYDNAIKKFGKIDVLINNAGILSDSSISNLSISQWNKVIDTNLSGTFHCCKAFSNIMMKQHSGKIINIASIKGLKGSKNQINYCSSKAGVIALTKSLAKELGEFNVSVNSVCPGFIKTNLNKDCIEKENEAEEKSVLKYSNLLAVLNSFILFMCSNEFDGVSGQNFILDSRIN